jgi:hypothetical protein
MSRTTNPGGIPVPGAFRTMVSLAALAALGAMGDASARPGNAGNVRQWCLTAGRPAPVITADECSTCHDLTNFGRMTDKKIAYLAMNLDAFCPEPVRENSAPNLSLAPSGGQTVLEGQTLKIAVSAADPDGDPVTLAAESLPPGAGFDPATGGFEWTPAVGSKGVYEVLFKATDRPSDASRAKTVQQAVRITVAQAGAVNTAPRLDAIPTPQSAAAFDKLVLRVAALDADDDELVLSASNLPPGAEFQNLGLADGKWTGEFRWRPTRQQVGRSFTTTFVARESGVSPAQQDALDVEFQVTAPSFDPVIKKVLVERSRYRSGILKVRGRVKFKTPPAGAGTLVVNITDKAGNPVGQTVASGNGRWTFAMPVAADAVPCRIKAEVNGVVSAGRPTKPIPPGCPVPKPVHGMEQCDY